MIRPTRTLVAVLALAGLVGLAACGDDGDDAANPEVTEVEDATTVPPADAEDCAGTTGETVTVEVPDFEFAPDALEVSTCDEVVWSNAHTQSHTSTGNGDFSWSTGNIAAGEDSDPVLFTTPGEFAYMCALHPFMKGTVTVS